MTLYGAPFADPLRPWDTDADPLIVERRYTATEIGALVRAMLRPYTDEEPWSPADPDPIRGVDLLDAAVVGSGAWLWLTAAVVAALVAVLALIGLRRLAR